MISRFFIAQPLANQTEVALTQAQVQHATRVLRLDDGASLVVFDGLGGEYQARLRRTSSQWLAQLVQWHATERESPLAITLVQGLASADKMDWIIRKAVELGVRQIIPLEAKRSLLRLHDSARRQKRLAHWQQIVVSACEQSGRNRLPLLEMPQTLAQYFAQSPAVVPQRWYCSPHEGRLPSSLPRPDAPLHLLIGPEAGWDDSEMQLALHHGCQAIQAGQRILRTETAGLALLAAAQALWGDF